MKIFCIIIVAFFLSSCTLPPEYTGDKFTCTKSVEIFYSANEVKRPYKIIGHFVVHKYIKSAVEKSLIYGAKKIGADGVIILGADAGNPNRIDADAIKYN